MNDQDTAGMEDGHWKDYYVERSAYDSVVKERDELLLKQYAHDEVSFAAVEAERDEIKLLAETYRTKFAEIVLDLEADLNAHRASGGIPRQELGLIVKKARKALEGK